MRSFLSKLVQTVRLAELPRQDLNLRHADQQAE